METSNNFTENQNNILEQIKKEFTKINDSKKSSSTLLSKNFFDSKILQRNNNIKEIEINNENVIKSIIQLIYIDIEKLNNCISEMGLIATKYNDNLTVRIDIKGEENRNFPNVNFSYEREEVYESIDEKDSKIKYIGFKGISFYTNPCNATIFKNIEDLCENEYFIRAIQSKYESAKTK